LANVQGLAAKRRREVCLVSVVRPARIFIQSVVVFARDDDEEDEKEHAKMTAYWQKESGPVPTGFFGVPKSSVAGAAAESKGKGGKADKAAASADASGSQSSQGSQSDSGSGAGSGSGSGSGDAGAAKAKQKQSYAAAASVPINSRYHYFQNRKLGITTGFT
jgi:hypothetical protein